MTKPITLLIGLGLLIAWLGSLPTQRCTFEHASGLRGYVLCQDRWTGRMSVRLVILDKPTRESAAWTLVISPSDELSGAYPGATSTAEPDVSDDEQPTLPTEAPK